MSNGPTRAAEAARALHDVDQRREQAARAYGTESRWVSVVFGVVLFAQMAAPDFFGDGVRPWMSWLVFGLVAVYMVMLRTRRGSDLLGRPARARKSEISPAFAYGARLLIVLVVLLGFAGALYMDHELFPYAGTVMGALLCGGLILFGPAWQRGLNSLAVRGPGGGGIRGSR